jgi:hypothetical protein
MKAFPHIAKVHMLDGNSIIKEEITSGGMDLRDYFAAKAMQTFIRISRDNYSHGNPSEGGFSWVSEMAYKQADAMIKARNNDS